MKRLLLRGEKETLRSSFDSIIICKLLYSTCKHTEKSLKIFRLYAEQMVLECITIIDSIRSRDPQDAKSYIGTLWDELYCDYRELSPENTPEQELKTVVATILHGVVLILSHCQNYVTFYLSLENSILSQCTHPIDGLYCPEINDQYSASTFKFDEKQLCDEITRYFESNDFISDDLKGTITSSIEENDEVSTTSGNTQITYRQLVILFEQILNVSLNANFSNQSELARFIGFVSGKNPEKLRKLISKGLDYSDRQTSRDIEYLAKRLEPINAKIASTLLTLTD